MNVYRPSRSAGGEALTLPENDEDIEFAQNFAEHVANGGLRMVLGTRSWTEANFYAAVVTEAEWQETEAWQINKAFDAHVLARKSPADFDFDSPTKLSWGSIKHLSTYCEDLTSREAALTASEGLFKIQNGYDAWPNWHRNPVQ